MNASLRNLVDRQFPESKADLFAVMVERGLSLARHGAHLGFMSPFVWMFVSSFEKLRIRLTSTASICSLIQLEYSGFADLPAPIHARHDESSAESVSTGIPSQAAQPHRPFDRCASKQHRQHS